MEIADLPIPAPVNLAPLSAPRPPKPGATGDAQANPPAADAQPSLGEDRVTISPAAREAARREAAAEREGHGEHAAESTEEADRDQPGRELTDEEREQVDELRSRDREVRTHEMAHKAAAGSLASGGPTYTYQRGPDGKRYAVGGEVQIQLREGRTPRETLQNAQRVQRAANAPSEPSAQDRAVAARAAAMAANAQREIAAERGGGSDAEDGGTAPNDPLAGRTDGGEGRPGAAASAIDLLA